MSKFTTTAVSSLLAGRQLADLVANVGAAERSVGFALNAMQAMRADPSARVAKAGEDTEALQSARDALQRAMGLAERLQCTGGVVHQSAIESHIQAALEVLVPVVADEARGVADETRIAHALCRAVLDALLKEQPPQAAALAVPVRAAPKSGKPLSAAKCRALAASFHRVLGGVMSDRRGVALASARGAIKAAGLNAWGELNYGAIGQPEAYALLTLHATSASVGGGAVRASLSPKRRTVAHRPAWPHQANHQAQATKGNAA